MGSERLEATQGYPEGQSRPDATQAYGPAERARDSAYASAASDRLEALPGSIGGYTILRELGRGANGVVYLAQRPGLPRKFALKTLPADYLGDEEAEARFQLEARVASRIADRGVVAVYDLGRDGQQQYFVMDYCPGDTLRQRLRRGPLPWLEAARLVASLARTMDAAHGCEVVHRDLKPANVILHERTGQPRVTDFGLAQDHRLLRMTQTGDMIGTPYYMSPEQVRAEGDLDSRCDIYALGVILYECLTGQLPFPGATIEEVIEAILAGKPVPPRRLLPELPATLDTVCLRALARRRDDRFASGRDLAEALEGLIERHAGEPSPEAPRRRRRAPLVGGVLLLIGVLGLGIPWALRAGRARDARARLEQAAPLPDAAALPLLRSALALAEHDPALSEAIRREARARRARAVRARLAELLGADGSPAAARALLTTEAQRPLWADEPADPALDAALRAAARELARDVLAAGPPSAAGVPLLAVLCAGDPTLEHRLEGVRLAGRLDAALADGPPAGLSALLARLQEFPDERRLPRLERGVEARALLDEARLLARADEPLERLLAQLQEAARLAAECPRLEESIRLERTRAYHRRGRYALVIEEGEALAASPGRVGLLARYLVGLSRLRLGELERAKTTLLDLARADPEGALGLSADSLVGGILSGRPRAALALARRAVAADPREPEALIQLAAALDATQRAAEAAAAARRARDAAPDHPRAHLILARTRLPLRDHTGAWEAFSQAIRLTEPEPLVEALRQRALLAMQLKRHEQAAEDLARLVERRPDELDAYFVRGVALDALGRSEAAEQEWRRVAARDPAHFAHLLANWPDASLRERARDAVR